MGCGEFTCVAESCLPGLINSLSTHYSLEKQGSCRGRFSLKKLVILHIVGTTFVFLLLLQPGKREAVFKNELDVDVNAPTTTDTRLICNNS